MCFNSNKKLYVNRKIAVTVPFKFYQNTILQLDYFYQAVMQTILENAFAYILLVSITTEQISRYRKNSGFLEELFWHWIYLYDVKFLLLLVWQIKRTQPIRKPIPNLQIDESLIHEYWLVYQKSDVQSSTSTCQK